MPAAVLAVTVLSQPGPALAHAALLDTAPADGTTVTTVTTEVTLTFNEPVRATFSTVAVTGPDGVAYGDGELSVVNNVVHQPVYPLRSGDYQVAWRVVSADGHPVSGTFAFTVRLPAGQEPTVTPPATPAPEAGEEDVSAASGWR